MFDDFDDIELHSIRGLPCERERVGALLVSIGGPEGSKEANRRGK